MSPPEENRKEAAELGKRAGRQSRQAAKNAGRAARVAAQPALEEVQDVAEKIEGTAEEAVKTAKRVSPLALSRITGNTGQGFLALSVAIYAGAFAANKFRGAYATRNQVVMPKRPHVPSEPAV